MPAYNGHKNWNHWNVSLWINNDEMLYRRAKDCVTRSRSWCGFDRTGTCETPREKAVRWFMEWLEQRDIAKTPDGARFSASAVRAAMRGL